jgi:hypothetical protein
LNKATKKRLSPEDSPQDDWELDPETRDRFVALLAEALVRYFKERPAAGEAGVSEPDA